MLQKVCIYCGKTMYDLTHGYGDFRNYICYDCGAHSFREKFYTSKEWEEWVNDV